MTKLTTRHRGRETGDFTSRRLPRDDLLDSLVLWRPSPAPTYLPENLTEVEDRRRWDPEVLWGSPAFTPRTFSRSVARIGVANNRNRPSKARGAVFSPWSFPAYQLGFKNPAKVVLCVRRKIRREVLHARHVAGRSPKTFRPRRRGWFSSIGC